MIYLITLFILALGIFVFWVLPGARRKTLGVGMFALLAIGSYAMAFEIMGFAKPRVLEWRELKGLPVVGFYWEENKAIWVWVLRDGVPVAYALPWSKEDAQSMESARRGSEESGGSLTFTDGDGDPPVGVDKPPPLPEKSD
jgi:hypothetical protein